MPADEQGRGDPPSNGLPSLAGYPDWQGLAVAVQRQVNELIQLRYQPAVRHEQLRLLEERRRRGPGQPEQGPPGTRDAAASGEAPPAAPTPFAYLPADVGFDTLLVPEQLLITKDSYERARPYLDELGLTEGPLCEGIDCPEEYCEELRRRVVRLAHPRMSPGELADVATNLRMRGFAASLTYITPTAPVHKKPTAAVNPIHDSDVLAAGKTSRERAVRAAGPPAGTPAKVAIIDTGIDRARLPMVQGEQDFLHEFPLGLSAQARDDYLDFDAGHGTFVAGIVWQLAPDAAITVYRAIDGDGIGSEVAVACKMLQAASEGAQIINLSLGCQTQDDFPPVALHAAVEILRERERDTGQQVIIIAAAGNFGDTRPCWPAALPGVVSVAGLAPDMLPSLWSSHGYWVTCSAVAEGVLSTYVPGQVSPLITTTPVVFTAPDPWALWTGTSFAAPQIAGFLAREYQSSPGPLRAALDTYLATSGQPVAGYGRAVRILSGI
jgi:hypothetical protein